MFRKNFKALWRLPTLTDQLSQYDISFRSLPETTVVRFGLRVTIPITAYFQLTGEVGWLDHAADGRYAVWFLAGRHREWQGELRMPLIQHYMAGQMMVRPEMVDVGFYFFDIGEYESACYNADELAEAVREARALGTALAA